MSQFSSTNKNADENQMTHITTPQSFAIGALSGKFATLFETPFMNIKFRQQLHLPITRDLFPFKIYSGLTTNMASMIPITAMQFGFNFILQGYLYEDVTRLSLSQQMLTASLSGAASGLISGPAELAIMRQGLSKQGFFNTARTVLKEDGVRTFKRGLPATMMREGVYNSCTLVLTPLFKAAMPLLIGDIGAALLAGIGSGLIAASSTQPIDNIKTLQQKHNEKSALSFLSAAKIIYKKSGSLGFLSGMSGRAGQVIMTITPVMFAKDRLDKWMTQYNKRKC